MKLSMMSYTVGRQADHFNLERMLDLTVELKLDGIDFVTLHGEDPDTLRAMCDDRGIPVVCHTFMAHQLAQADAAARQEGLDLCSQAFEAAHRLGTRVTMIPTPGAETAAREDNHAAWVNGLRRAAELAAAADIILTVENFPGRTSPFVIADDLEDGMRRIPNLKVTYDAGNTATGEEPAASFRRIAPHVVHAHFKDWFITDEPAEGARLMLDGRYYRPALIGEGDLDHRAVLEAMRDSGYAGCINIEYEGNDVDPYEATRRAADFLRREADAVGY